MTDKTPETNHSQSREAIDELKSRGDLTLQQHEELLKIIGFRNVLVHDYLDINDSVVQAVVTQKHYAVMGGLVLTWRKALDAL